MARGGRRGRPKANQGHCKDRERSPQASTATISPKQSRPVISPSSERQISGTVHQQYQNQTRVLSSFTSMVDPDEGMSLEFIPFNGTKCVKLAQEDIKEVNQTSEKAESRGEDGFQLATKHITRHYVPRAIRKKETATPDDLLKLRSLIQAMANAVIYHLWLARNRMLFKNEVYPV
ncbi:LOW QUALITY PROTEIN: hypothetical protein Cgig2_015223 [Carnegiea gigantea]|uniref:Uncharacterized protein n=1 Tax=Carnegiea gigantea TaxID=171969 RepID=A0A9Q1JLS8_9CARY|nr:LOW QUALITY PROTEIN: hypothetical protein Cgig2_015223 [Carnegiea gigantea]